MKNVTGKVVLITGASSGIGEATARLLAKNGATVVLGARRTDRLEQIAADIRKEGGTVEIKTLDVTKRDDVTAFVKFAHEKFGRVDVLFNNAGIMPLGRMDALELDTWDDMVNINIKGVLHGIGAVLPIMKSQGYGHIINTASIGAHLVSPTAAVYCATKYAVWAISEGLRQESEEIRVTAISPGVTETELGHDIKDEGARDFLKDIRKKSIGPDAVARAVLYAIEQPMDVDINEVVIRATASPY
jgi:NADP-dependent 3-hydroxy acid dehydrogenase YdfG